MLVADLVYHSVISFRFGGQKLARGWTEALIVGDSRTGKSATVTSLVSHYGAGEIVTGENTSFAGLVGGLTQVGGKVWTLLWGKIPLNDRRLLVIDEAGNLPTQDIERMSSMRSSGIAEVVKIHTERTNARTRQIWITNPRSPRPLSSWSQGVLAVKEVIGKPEDIARFDLIATASSGDVDLGTINTIRETSRPSVYTADLCHQRVMWAWSRKSDQVEFTIEAEAQVMLRATQQGEEYRYATEIPVVEPNEQRIKLARLSVAVAAMFFSSSEDGERIIVKPEHVEFAYEFLERLYRKPSLAFADYARTARRQNELRNTAEVASIVDRQPHIAEALMEQESFTQAQLAEIFDINDSAQRQETAGKLVKYGFFKRGRGGYYFKTPAAIEFLRLRIDGAGFASRFTEVDDVRVPF